MPGSGPFSVHLWRDRVVVLAGLVLVTAAAWLYLVELHQGAAGMHARLSRGQMSPWGVGQLLFALLVWSVMMIGMMLPSASPMVLAFSGTARNRSPESHLGRTGMFVLGYVLVWIGYSALGAMAQWVLHAGALLTPRGVSTSPYLAGGLLLTAGAFQLTPLKYACLEKCRSPFGFLLHEWRPGSRGALVMGARHGMNCVACCWAMMALMLVLGVMNLWWMVALTAFSLVEKIAPAPVWTGRAVGVVLVAWGVLAVAAG